MALHTELPIYKVAYDLFDMSTELAKNMPRDFKQSVGGKLRDECLEITVLIFRANCARDKAPHLGSLVEGLYETANSYFGLLRQASHSHTDRARLGRLVLRRGHCIDSTLTKTYRTHKETA